MNFQPINPKPFLQSLLNKQVIVKLKFNSIEYRGRLLSIDNYMNLLMDKDVKEVNGKTQDVSPLGDQMFIRCNNVLWICEDKGEEKEKDEKDKKDEKDEGEKDEKDDDEKDEKDENKKSNEKDNNGENAEKTKENTNEKKNDGNNKENNTTNKTSKVSKEPVDVDME